MVKAKNNKTKLQKNKKAKKQNGRKSIKKTQKKLYKSVKFWVILGVAFALLVVALVVTVGSNDRRKETLDEYEEVWNNYASAQRDFGYEFGLILGEMGFSMDGSTKYDLNSSDQYSMSKQCAEKVGVYDEIYDNSYAVKDKDIASKNTADVRAAINILKEYTEKINNAKTLVEKCREVGQEKINKINEEIAKKEAEEKAKAEEEAAKKKQQEEAQAAYRKNVLNYEKFNNQIKEGMSLNAVKEVYGGFDSQCKVSSQSGGWTFYSCSPSYYSSNYWVASFTFYNNILKSKSQTGLD